MFENNNEVVGFIIGTFIALMAFFASMGCAFGDFFTFAPAVGIIHKCIVFGIMGYWALYSRYLMDVYYKEEEN